MTTARQADGKDAVALGILFLILGAALAGLGGATLRWLAPEMNPVLLAWGRYVGYSVLVVPLAFTLHGRAAIRPPRRGMQILRAVLMLGTTLCYVLSVARLPLAETASLFYVYPFLIILLAPFLVGERVLPLAWLGVVGGFAGVLLVMRPTPGQWDAGILFGLAAGVFYTLHVLVTRRIARGASPVVTLAFTTGTNTLLLTPLIPFVWQPLGWFHVWAFLVMGAINAGMHWLVFLALARAPASTLAPFTYVEIVSAATIGLVWFGEVPDGLTWSGIGLIIASGVLVARAARGGATVDMRRGTGA